MAKNPLRIEVFADFPMLVRNSVLYPVEKELCALYGAASFRIFPHFPSSLFDLSRMAEIATEAAMSGAVTHGFFHNATYDDN